MFDVDHPFLAPPWRRVALLAACALWGLFEAWNGNRGWALVFWGAGAVAYWQFRKVDWSKYDQPGG